MTVIKSDCLQTERFVQIKLSFPGSRVHIANASTWFLMEFWAEYLQNVYYNNILRRLYKDNSSLIQSLGLFKVFLITSCMADIFNKIQCRRLREAYGHPII